MTKAEAIEAISEAWEERYAIARIDGGQSHYRASRLADESASRVRAGLRVDLMKGVSDGENQTDRAG